MSESTTFQVTSWNEDAAQELDGGIKITRARVTQLYEGYIEGEGSVEYVMYHRADGSAIFVGIEHVVGAVGGKPGSLALQHTGVFEGGSAKSAWLIVPDSATGGLKGMKGSGSFVAGHDMKAEVTTDIAFG